MFPLPKKDRLVALYTPDREADDGTVKRSSARPATSYLTKPKMFLGGAGLVSTARDYLRFSQMLLNGGELDGVRLLSPKTVELMTRDHIGDMSRAGALLPPGAGFGLTMAVTTDAGIAGGLGSDGEFRWGGAAGTRFWVDPKEEMVTLFMINILPYSGLSYSTQFKNLAYQSIVE